MRWNRWGVAGLAILAALLLAGSPALARRGFGGGFGGGGFGRSFSSPSSGGSRGLGQRSGGSGFFGFGRRSSGFGASAPSHPFSFGRPSSSTAVQPPPAARPGGFGRSSFGRTPGSGSFGFGRGKPTNLSTPPPSARPRGFGGTTTGRYGSSPLVSHPYSGRTVVVMHNHPYMYDYHPFGVWVPYGYSPWGFYGYHYWPWMFSNPYPSSFGYTGYAPHVSILASLFSTLFLLAMVALVIWIVVKVAGAFSGSAGRGYDRPARYS